MTLEPVIGVQQARDEWGANCGPTAIAAALSFTMDKIRVSVSPSGRFKGYMGIRDIREAVARAGRELGATWSKVTEPIDALAMGYTLRAVAADLGLGVDPVIIMLRFSGPWNGIPRAAATYRHVICYRHCIEDGFEHEQRVHGPGWVLDANQRTERGDAYWLPARIWSRRTLLDLLPERGDGCVVIDWIARPRPQA